MKILVIDNHYPYEGYNYGDVFAHIRVKEYLNYYTEIIVCSNFENKIKERKSLSYEGVQIRWCIDHQDIIENIDKVNPDLILIHFASSEIINKIIFTKSKYNYIIWVHGGEAISNFRYHYEVNFKSFKSIKNYLLGSLFDFKKLYLFRKLIKLSNKTGNIHFVYISDWMKKVNNFDCLISSKNYSIIPNPINVDMFKFKEKSIENIKNVLIIRPFRYKKYATDLMTEVIFRLKEIGILDYFTFTIVSADSKDSKLYKDFKTSINFTFIENFLNHKEIKELHDKCGVYFSLSRMDAQGVSMCEAASSGLVVFTSKNTAIPEFFTSETSILTNNKPSDIVPYFEEILKQPEKFIKLGKKGSLYIKEKSGIKEVIDKEIQLINKFLDKI